LLIFAAVSLANAHLLVFFIHVDFPPTLLQRSQRKIALARKLTRYCSVYVCMYRHVYMYVCAGSVYVCMYRHVYMYVCSARI
jgi:hypothetical protein